MTKRSKKSKSDTVALAAALSSRTTALSEAASQAAAGIERDRRELVAEGSDADSTGDLVSVLSGRVDEIAADCRELATILAGFASLVADARAEAARDFGAADAGPAVDEPELTWDVTPAVPRLAAVKELDAPPEDETEAAEVSEGVRLLATQMSVAGAEVSEIARRLEDDFGVENAGLVVGQVFGLNSSAAR